MISLIDHDHEICNENCLLKKYFNSIHPNPFIKMKSFLNMFHVPFEFNTEEKTISSLKNVNVLFIGEAGGQNEAKFKRPFYPYAPSGKILREAIKDLKIINYAIANIVGCRPVFIDNNGIYRNRTPDENECEYCISNLKSFICMLNKKLKIILLGKTAAFSVLKNVKEYTKDHITITPLVKLEPLKYKNIIYGVNFHPRFIASGGGIKGKRYKEYLKRFEVILNE